MVLGLKGTAWLCLCVCTCSSSAWETLFPFPMAILPAILQEVLPDALFFATTPPNQKVRLSLSPPSCPLTSSPTQRSAQLKICAQCMPPRHICTPRARGQGASWSQGFVHQAARTLPGLSSAESDSTWQHSTLTATGKSVLSLEVWEPYSWGLNTKDLATFPLDTDIHPSSHQVTGVSAEICIITALQIPRRQKRP